MRPASYDAEKFREMLVYIAEQTADEVDFGDTKVNKTLYWIDFFGYSHLGQAVTGAKYQKGKLGPLARPLLPVRRELEEKGAVRTDERKVGPRQARVTVALRRADRSLFSKEELELADAIIRQVKEHTAVSVSALSHRQSPGWNLVDMGDDIPYETALVSTEQPSEETAAEARHVAARLGW